MRVTQGAWNLAGSQGPLAVAESMTHKHESERAEGSSVGFETLRAYPSNTPPSTKPHLLILSEQLGTKYSNIWAYTGHFNSNYYIDMQPFMQNDWVTIPMCLVKNQDQPDMALGWGFCSEHRYVFRISRVSFCIWPTQGLFWKWDKHFPQSTEIQVGPFMDTSAQRNAKEKDCSLFYVRTQTVIHEDFNILLVGLLDDTHALWRGVSEIIFLTGVEIKEGETLWGYLWG